MRILYIFLLAAFFGVLFKIGIPKISQTEAEKKMYWIKTAHVKNNADIVIVGDSRVYRGINPAAFETHFPNQVALNFAYSSAGLSKKYLLNAITKLKNQRGILVLGITPFSLTKEAMKNEHLQSFMNIKKEEIIESLYFSPLMATFQSINPRFIIDKRYLKEKKLQKDSTFYHEKYHSNGWVASNKLKHDIQITIDSYQKSFSRTTLDWNNINLSLDFIKQLVKKKIKIYCFRPPIHPDLVKIENKFCFEEYETIKKVLLKNGVIWIDMPIITTKGTYDGSHLKSDFASAFSERLAKKIKLSTLE